MRKGEQARPWTEADEKLAKAMHEDDCSIAEIARALNRSEAAIEHRLSPRGPRVPYHAALFKLRAEAERRCEASQRRDMTATFCGDPPPGYSALDQRGAR